VVFAEMICHDDGRPQHWMSGEWHFTRRCEDPNPCVGALQLGVDKDGLRVADLEREWLQECLGDACRVLEDGELVSRQRAVGKDVDEAKWPAFHGTS
jgi:hypothetical protein